jgi:hypothetical protein
MFSYYSCVPLKNNWCYEYYSLRNSDMDSKNVWNVGQLVPDYTAQYSKITSSSNFEEIWYFDSSWYLARVVIKWTVNCVIKTQKNFNDNFNILI